LSLYVGVGQDIVFLLAKTTDRSKNSGQNFFSKHLHPQLAAGAPVNLLRTLFRFAFDPLSKHFRPRKPYVVLTQAVKLERNKPLRLT
jgi:hypothetical protein